MYTTQEFIKAEMANRLAQARTSEQVATARAARRNRSRKHRRPTT
jgi:hypothetical protein